MTKRQYPREDSIDGKRIARAAAKWAAVVAGIAAGSYATYVGVTWFRYGRLQPAEGADIDPSLDLFIPDYDVVDCHHAYVTAPAEITLAAAMEMDFESNAIIRGIFKTREWILRAEPEHAIRPRGFMEEMKCLGWGVLEFSNQHSPITNFHNPFAFSLIDTFRRLFIMLVQKDYENW